MVKATGEIRENITTCPNCAALESLVERTLEPVAKRFDRLLRLMKGNPVPR